MFRAEAEAEIAYFPACVSRIMGSSNLAKPSLVETVLKLADRAGIKVRLPKSVLGVCCGQIWGHRGFTDSRRYIANQLVEAMWEWSDGGRVRVMCDVSSCTKTILSEVEGDVARRTGSAIKESRSQTSCRGSSATCSRGSR